MRVFPVLLRGFRQTDPLQHRLHAFFGPGLVSQTVLQQDAAQLCTDRQIRVQRLQWVLKNDRHFLRTQCIDGLVAGAKYVGAGHANAATCGCVFGK